MREFTEADVQRRTDSQYATLCADRSELVDDAPSRMRAGLQQTASGYGSKLNSGLKIHFAGKLRRIYVTCYSNAGSSWFTVKGEKIYIR